MVIPSIIYRDVIWRKTSDKISDINLLTPGWLSTGATILQESNRHYSTYVFLTHWGWDKFAGMSQMTFSNAFFIENEWTSLKILLKLAPKVGTKNVPALVLIMAWHQPGDKLLSEPVMVSLLMHICVNQLSIVNWGKNPGGKQQTLLNLCFFK